MCAALFCACATNTDVKQVESKLEQQKSAADSLGAQLAESRAILEEAKESQKRTEAGIEVALKNQADSKADHDVMVSKVNSLSAGLEENAHYLKTVDDKLKKLEERVRELQILTMESGMAHNQRIESLLAEIRGTAPDARKPIAEKKPEKKPEAKPPAKPEKGKAEEAAKEKPAPKPKAASAEDLYNSAYKNFLRGDYAQAAAEFAEYVKRYPGTDLSDNSQYWIGEAYANQGKLKEAAEAFKMTAKNFPKSTKAPAALWRAAEIFEKFGANEEVRAILAKIRDNYPASYEAALAEEKLKATEGQQ